MSNLILVECDEAEAREIAGTLRSDSGSEYDFKIAEKRRLDGAAPTWIVAAALASHVIVKILSFIQNLRVERIKITLENGVSIEIERPSRMDVEVLIDKIITETATTTTDSSESIEIKRSLRGKVGRLVERLRGRHHDR